MLDLTTQSFRSRCIECLLCSGELEIEVVSDSVNLSVIRDKLKRITEHCKFSEKEIFDVQVAVGEAAANAIEHGSPQGSVNTIAVKANCDANSLKITVLDQGKFLKRVAPPDPEIAFRGRGIPIMLALMDKVLIDEGSDGTKVVLEKKIVDVVL